MSRVPCTPCHYSAMGRIQLHCCCHSMCGQMYTFQRVSCPSFVDRFLIWQLQPTKIAHHLAIWLFRSCEGRPRVPIVHDERRRFMSILRHSSSQTLHKWCQSCSRSQQSADARRCFMRCIALPKVMDSMPNMVTNMVRTVTELLTLLGLLTERCMSRFEDAA